MSKNVNSERDTFILEGVMLKVMCFFKDYSRVMKFFNYYHKTFHLRYCSSPGSVSEHGWEKANLTGDVWEYQEVALILKFLYLLKFSMLH